MLNLVCTQGPTRYTEERKDPYTIKGLPHIMNGSAQISYQKKFLQAHGQASEELNAREGLGRDVTVEKDEYRR